MIEVCMSSFYWTYFVASLIKNTLFFVGLRFSNGNIKEVIGLFVLFEIIILMTLPILMLITQGACT